MRPVGSGGPSVTTPAPGPVRIGHEKSREPPALNQLQPGRVMLGVPASKSGASGQILSWMYFALPFGFRDWRRHCHGTAPGPSPVPGRPCSGGVRCRYEARCRCEAHCRCEARYRCEVRRRYWAWPVPPGTVALGRNFRSRSRADAAVRSAPPGPSPPDGSWRRPRPRQR